MVNNTTLIFPVKFRPKKSPDQKYQNICLSSIIKDTPLTLISMTSQIFLKLSKNHLNLNQRDLSSPWNNSNVTFHHKSWDLPLWFLWHHESFPKRKKPFLKAPEIPKSKKYNFANKKAVLHQFWQILNKKNKKDIY